MRNFAKYFKPCRLSGTPQSKVSGIIIWHNIKI